ncbi:hypothetical protein [Polyangium sorediatum]|uniref:Uncharacterized protein n=1 Tax=Polyangium sorediatum TaxID=889274 RepID=A0ABT6PA63_9BACT|nr:hypothetical protein [Polyangium sorediatum]MDI1437409.1 hypothetical protein [Polyangium sorediatum]
MKRSQARKRQTQAPAPKTGFAKLITLFVRPRNDVREAAKKRTEPHAPRPMPAPFVPPAPPPSAAPEPEPASDPILRSVLAALAPDPDVRAPDALREQLVTWAEETSEPFPEELDGVLEALAPRAPAPAALRESLIAWAAETAEPEAPAPLDAAVVESPSLWKKLRRLARVLLERLRNASRGAR